jgi:hypothetical protein
MSCLRLNASRTLLPRRASQRTGETRCTAQRGRCRFTASVVARPLRAEVIEDGMEVLEVVV